MTPSRWLAIDAWKTGDRLRVVDMPKASDPLADYLENVGRYELLTPIEEIELSRIIQDYHAGGETTERRYRWAKNKLVNCNLRLAIMVARKYKHQDLPFLDLIQEGSIGLMKAADKYDGRRGTRFSTCAYHWIRQEITRAIIDQGSTIRLPVHTYEKLQKINKFRSIFRSQNDRWPTAEELASELEVTVDALDQLLEYKRPLLHLNRPIDRDENDGELVDVLAIASDEVPEIRVDELLTSQFLQQCLHKLPANERTIVEYHYGMVDGKCHSFTSAGLLAGYRNRTTARLAHDRALKKLQCFVDFKVAV